MTDKQKRLAARMLGEYSADLGNRGCNDWEWPEDWTQEERVAFTRAFHDYNGDPEEFDPDWIRLEDFCVASLLAHLIESEALAPEGRGE